MILTGRAPAMLMREFSEKIDTATFNKPQKQVSKRLPAAWTERDEAETKNKCAFYKVTLGRRACRFDTLQGAK